MSSEIVFIFVEKTPAAHTVTYRAVLEKEKENHAHAFDRCESGQSILHRASCYIYRDKRNFMSLWSDGKFQPLRGTEHCPPTKNGKHLFPKLPKLLDERRRTLRLTIGHVV